MMPQLHLDANEILARLRKEGITALYHFTCVENLPYICQAQELWSKQKLEDEGKWSSLIPGTIIVQKKVVTGQKTERKDAYYKILAWEISLHEIFQDEIEDEKIIVHPTLGRGKIEKKVEKSIKREDYIAKLVSVKFDCGQSCTFHSRVQSNERVSESLAEDIINALK